MSTYDDDVISRLLQRRGITVPAPVAPPPSSGGSTPAGGDGGGGGGGGGGDGGGGGGGGAPPSKPAEKHPVQPKPTQAPPTNTPGSYRPGRVAPAARANPTSALGQVMHHGGGITAARSGGAIAPHPKSQVNPTAALNNVAERHNGGVSYTPRAPASAAGFPAVPKLTSQWRTTEGRERTAVDYFRKTLGLSRIAAAALVGNMALESTNFRRHGSPELVSSLGEIGGGGGYGIAQWTLPARKQALAAAAQHLHLPISNFGLQLAYAANELRTRGASKSGALIAPDTLQDLRHARSLGEAVAVVEVGFEHPGGRTGLDYREVPRYGSVLGLLRELGTTPLPAPRSGNDRASYWDRRAETLEILHEDR
jgi:hypothetical protein